MEWTLHLDESATLEEQSADQKAENMCGSGWWPRTQMCVTMTSGGGRGLSVQPCLSAEGDTGDSVLSRSCTWMSTLAAEGGGRPTGWGFLSLGSQVHSVCSHSVGELEHPYIPPRICLLRATKFWMS